MLIEEIRVITHFGAEKASDVFVRTDAGRNINASIRWGGETLTPERAVKLMSMIASAIAQGAAAIEQTNKMRNTG